MKNRERNIDLLVDEIIQQEREAGIKPNATIDVTPRKSFKRARSSAKKGISILTTFVIVAVLAGASLFGFFVVQEDTLEVSGLLEFDGSPAGDLTSTDTLFMYGNCTNYTYHTLEYVGEDGTFDLDFVFSSDPVEAITDGSITVSFTLNDIPYTDNEALDIPIAPGDFVYINTTYYTNILIVPDTYTINLSISPTV